MNRFRYLTMALVGWMVPTSLGLALEEENIPVQPRLSFTVGSSGTWNADWQGVGHRVYFLQWSLDLVNWNYAPFMEFGAGLKSKGSSSTSVRFFVRLRYADADWIDTLQEAKDADFDGDGIPNLFEVETIGSDPFDGDSAGGDSDNDGMVDGWELYHYGDLSTADPNAKHTPDGLTNKEKSEIGLGPYGDDITAATERITYNYDGERLDGVTFYTQRAFGYGLDGNGNIGSTTSD
jgi:hypothetical protein